jgi:hypothetical protein
MEWGIGQKGVRVRQSNSLRVSEIMNIGLKWSSMGQNWPAMK